MRRMAHGAQRLGQLFIAVTVAALLAVPAAGAQTCGGDCDNSSEVTVDEILLIVNIALGIFPVGDCLPGDLNADNTLTVDEILTAVDNALKGCAGAGPDPTPTATATPVATPTSGSSADLDAVEAFVAGVVPAIASFGEFGNLGGTGAAAAAPRGFTLPPIPPITVDCPGGGTFSYACNGFVGPSTTELDFSTCRFVAPDNSEFTLDGSFSQQSPVACFGVPLPADATLVTSFDGSFAASDPNSGRTFSGTFDTTVDITIRSDGATILDMDGTANVPCVGQASLQTRQPLRFSPSGVCPAEGSLGIVLNGTPSEIIYNAGGVAIDLGDNGSVDRDYGSCADPQLRPCEG